MGEFKEYFTGLFAVSILCVMCELLSGFTSKSITSALKLVCNLSILLTVFSSVFTGCDIHNSIGLLKNAAEANTAQASSLTEEYLIESTVLELENNVSSVIYEKFGIKPVNVSIDFSTESKDGITEIKIASVQFTFPPGTDSAVVSAASSYTEGLFGTDTEIIRNRSS